MRVLKLLIPLITIVVAGCASNSVDLRTYTNPSINNSNITNIAIFPIRNTRLSAGDAQELSRAFNRVFVEKNPNIHILNTAESIDLLNENNLAEDYASFLRDFAVSGIPDARILNRIGEGLEVESIIQGEIIEIRQRDGQMGGQLATTSVTMRYYMISTINGDLLWEATSSATKQPTVAETGLSRSVFTPPPPIIGVIREAQNKILSDIPELI